jgi:hypothetical protein
LPWQEISNFLGFGLWIKFVKGKNCVNFNQFSRTFVSLFFTDVVAAQALRDFLTRQVPEPTQVKK